MKGAGPGKALMSEQAMDLQAKRAEEVAMELLREEAEAARKKQQAPKAAKKSSKKAGR